MLSFEDDGNVTAYSGNYTEYHNWRERDKASVMRVGSQAQHDLTRK